MIINNIPIFQECEEFSDLEKIAEVNNKRFLDTGDPIVLCLGHNEESVEQPVVGKAYDLAVDTLGILNPKKVLTATLEIAEEYKDLIKQFPRRSVEIYEDMVISALALLGSTRPAFDLGTTFKFSSKSYRYQYNSEENLMDKENLMAIVEEAITKFEITSKLEDVIDRISKLENASLENASPEEDELLTPEEEKEEPIENSTSEDSEDSEVAEEVAPEEEPVEEVVPEEEKEEKEFPSGTNTTVPELIKDKEEEEDEEKKKYSFEALQNQYKSKFDFLNAENNKLKIENTKLSRQLVLNDLSLKYSFDSKSELDLVEKMSDEDFTRHTEIIKKSYSAVPLHRAIVSPAVEQETISKERVAEIVRFATKNGLTFAAAKEKFDNKI